jgi:hypothetical protein
MTGKFSLFVIFFKDLYRKESLIEAELKRKAAFYGALE